MGLKRGKSSLQTIKKSIENLLWENFLIRNDNFTDYSRERRSILYIENMISDYAHREYASKGSDKLGYMKLTFLNASDFYTKTT